MLIDVIDVHVRTSEIEVHFGSGVQFAVDVILTHSPLVKRIKKIDDDIYTNAASKITKNRQTELRLVFEDLDDFCANIYQRVREKWSDMRENGYNWRTLSYPADS